MVVGIALLTIAVVGYFLSGSAPVATDAPPMPMEKYLAKKALHAVLDREMPKTVPIPVDEAIILPEPNSAKTTARYVMDCLGSQRRLLRAACSPRPQNYSTARVLPTTRPARLTGKLSMAFA